MLWVLLALLTGAAAFSILLPLARRVAGPSEPALDVAFYEAQLSEIDKDAARGLLGPRDVEATKTEAARRLLAATERQNRPARSSAWAIRGVALATIVLVPLLALGLYGALGRPQMPDLPLEARREAPAGNDIMMAIAKIEAHLVQNPADGRGFEVLAPVYLRLGRLDDAAQAAAASLRLQGETPERLAFYGEILVQQAGGRVTPAARQAFDKVLAQDKTSVPARFYGGLAAQQAGDTAGAARLWRALLADAPPGAPWTREVERRLAGESAPVLPGPASAPEQAKAIAAMPDADRQTAIRGMVDGLASRLAGNGGSIDEWLRLVRAYKVLNEPDKARTALVDARRNLGSDQSALQRLDALARELGLEG